MAFNISPQINIFERDFTLTLEMKGDTKGAQAGTTSWGPSYVPTLITAGEEGFRSKFWTPTDKNYLSYFIARDFLKYSNKLLFTRVNGPLARNSVASSPCIESKSIWSNDISFDTINYKGSTDYQAFYLANTGWNMAINMASVTTVYQWVNSIMNQVNPSFAPVRIEWRESPNSTVETPLIQIRYIPNTQEAGDVERIGIFGIRPEGFVNTYNNGESVVVYLANLFPSDPIVTYCEAYQEPGE